MSKTPPLFLLDVTASRLLLLGTDLAPTGPLLERGMVTISFHHSGKLSNSVCGMDLIEADNKGIDGVPKEMSGGISGLMRPDCQVCMSVLGLMYARDCKSRGLVSEPER